MKKLTFIFLIGLLISCKGFKEPVFVSFDGVDSFRWKEGKQVSFNLKATLENPNGYALKIKPCSLDVFVEKRKLGVLRLEKKIKLKGKRENNLTAPISVKLSSGAMFTLMRYAKRDSVSVRLEGEIKGGVFLFSKKAPIKIEKTISPKVLKELNY